MTLLTLDEYLTLPWRIRVQRRTDDGVYWAAEVEELPGLVAAGATWAELGEMLQDALVSYLSAMLESGEEIPLPHSAAA